MKRLLAPFDAKAESSISRLTDKKLLASSECWLAAYNAGSGFWVINNKPPYAVLPYSPICSLCV